MCVQVPKRDTRKTADKAITYVRESVCLCVYMCGLSIIRGRVKKGEGERVEKDGERVKMDGERVEMDGESGGGIEGVEERERERRKLYKN